MPDHLPESLKEEIENTLGLLDKIRKVTPREDLSQRIMACIHEASKPGHFPIPGGRGGEKIVGLKGDWEGENSLCLDKWMDYKFPFVSLN